MKNFTKLLIISSLLINTSAYADQANKSMLKAQVNLGSVYTRLNNYNGVGYKVSAQVAFPLSQDNSLSKSKLDFYGKVSHQSSKNKKQGNNFYFDENELSLGINYNINNKHRVFLEGGDIQQTFVQNEKGLWKDYFYVARLGTQIKQDDYNFQFAIVHRNGIDSATGYSSNIGFFNNAIHISYTDVGKYKSLGFSFQANF
jgi:hypothetical protein